MFAPLRPLLIVILAACLTGSFYQAHAQSRPDKTASKSEVIDDGGMFSKDAIAKAQESLGRIDRTYHVAVTVETVDSLRGQEIDEVAIRRAEQLGHQGIFVLIARQDRKVEALAAPKSLVDELTRPRLHSIRDAFTNEFRKGDVDAGLLKGVEAAGRALAESRPEVARAAAVSEGGTSAGTSPLVVRGQVRLSLAGAKKVIAGAEAKAVELQLKSNITVVDDAGQLLAFERMDGARPASISTSQTKAVSAATFRTATGMIASGGKEADPYFNASLEQAAGISGGKITTLLGGLPILVDGQIIGAIGVAGGSGEQDVEVAKAGIAAFVLGLSESTDAAKPKSDTVESMPR